MAKKKLHLPPLRKARKGEPKREIYAWAGFVDGKLYNWLSGIYDVEHLSIFRYKADAMRCHEDVRRVKIILQ